MKIPPFLGATRRRRCHLSRHGGNVVAAAPSNAGPSALSREQQIKTSICSLFRDCLCRRRSRLRSESDIGNVLALESRAA